MSKSAKKFLSSKLENHGINLSRDAATTGLTPKQDVIELLARLRPQDNGHSLIRVGGPGDGGYLIPDDLLGITELFSPGSNRLSNFEKEVAERWEIKSYICDSIEEKPDDLSTFQDFTPAWVGPYTDENKFISLAQWIEEKSQSSGDLMLQMDIEGAEFQTLMAVSTELMKRFRIIVIELHFLEALKNRWAFEQIYSPFFNKLLSSFDVIHAHPNNCCGVWSYGELEYPRLLELTLHRNDRGKYLTPKRSSRNQLDQPCVPSNRDLSLEFQQTGNGFEVVWDSTPNG
jgi:hypothetical protein